MSRIGKKQITIPGGVNATLEGNILSVVGPKGTLSTELVSDVNLEISDNEINIIPKDLGKRSRSMWGLTRTLVSNLIVGVTDGYKKTLEIQGVGYRAQVQGNILQLALGFSHDVKYEIPKEAIAIKKILYKFKHTGKGSACIMIWESPTNKWMSTIHKHHDKNCKSLDHNLDNDSSYKYEKQSELLNTLKSGDIFMF